jgi:hypothetical protein
MKQSSDTSFISPPKALQASRPDSGPTDHLFLGHKLLGELKILMRLSSTGNSANDNGSQGPEGQSY